MMVFGMFWATFNIYSLRVCLSVAIVAMNHQYHYTQYQTILSSFFWGYAATQLPGGYAATLIGGKHFLMIAIGMTAFLTLLTPITAEHLGEWGVIALRVLEGVFEGPSYPSMHTLVGRWYPVQQRALLTGTSYSGAFVGTIVGIGVSGWLCEQTFWGGWPLTFYVFGATSTVTRAAERVAACRRARVALVCAVAVHCLVIA
jgi:MFS family permease